MKKDKKDGKKKHPILTALLIILALFIIIGACSDGSDESDSITADNTFVLEETITSESPSSTKPTPVTTVASTDKTEENTDTEKYPKIYNEKGELIVYWLDSGSVWHESANCNTVKNADSAKLHSGTPTEAYSNGKERACKTCSADSVVVIPETTKDSEQTTKAPETTRVPETTRAPEATKVPDTTKTPETTNFVEDTEKVYWVTEGYVWHNSKDCWTLADSVFIYSGNVADAKAIGKERACKVCGDGSSVTDMPSEATKEPEITTEPEITLSPDTDSDKLTITSWPKTASRNETVSVTIKGKANTKYYIEVNYKTGPSTSKDLDPKTSNANGEITWTWKVGARSAAGTFDIIVKDDEGKSVKVEWTIIVD